MYKLKSLVRRKSILIEKKTKLQMRNERTRLIGAYLTQLLMRRNRSCCAICSVHFAPKLQQVLVRPNSCAGNTFRTDPMSSQKNLAVVLLATTAVICDDDDNDLSKLTKSRNMLQFKKAPVLRILSRFSSVKSNLFDFEFKRGFRMSRESFMLFLSRLQTH